jgi:SRSO17 transposase
MPESSAQEKPDSGGTRMALLDHPTAQQLLRDAEIPSTVLAGWPQPLEGFLQRYLPRFLRHEHRALATVVLTGKLSNLERKTAEPIARQAGRHRKPVQHFVGAGKWDDEAVLDELRQHVGVEVGAPDAALILDGSAFPKSGTDSCGVERQWCGRLGKIDNCQVGVFLGYTSSRGRALVDRRLYLPKDWAQATERRARGHVPADLVFRTKLEIGLDLIERCRALPHGWVLGDDEFGRSAAFRLALRRRRERYLLDVPGNTLVRDLEDRPAGGRKPPFERVAVWAARQPPRRWRKVVVRDGEQGRRVVRALAALVQTKDDDGGLGRSERLLVVRPVDHDGESTYALTSDLRETPLADLLRIKHQRPVVEQLFQEAKGEVGLGHYEVRSWVGWHHHMTLSLLALWYLHLGRRVVGGENSGIDGAPAAPAAGGPAGGSTHAGRPAARGQRNRAAHRGSPHLPLAAHEQVLSTTTC